VLRESKKLFLAPLARYWLVPCCDDDSHFSNYKQQGYLPRLNTAISGLRDYIRDLLFTRRVSKYLLLCPNKMIGLGPHANSISDDEA
jgi:hypothetical protein